MKDIDKVYYKRLELIRAELDEYIADLLEEEHIVETPVIANSRSEGISKKFLDIFRLNDDTDDYDDECYDDYEESCRPKASVHSTKTENSVRVPEFLQSSRPSFSLDKVLENKGETFSTMLLRMIDEKGLKDSEVYKRANIDRRLFSKIRGDEDYVPSKKTAISFCLALGLELDEAKKLLEAAGYALSEASRFDIIIMYLIESGEHNVNFANIVLSDYGEGSLSK